MARIRTIKPEFWTHAQIVECSTNARLLFIGLWNFCDDAGRHPLALKQIKAEIFPADPFDPDTIRRMIDELSSNDLITIYTVENKEYLSVNGWHHQKIDRGNPAKYPGPEEGTRRMIVERSSRESIKEGSLIDTSLRSVSISDKPKSRASQIGDYQPDEEALSAALAYWLGKGRRDLDAADQAARFRDHHLARGSAMKDWRAAWRTWYKNAVQFTRPENGTARPEQSARRGFLAAVEAYIAEPEAETYLDSAGETRLALPPGEAGRKAIPGSDR